MHTLEPTLIRAREAEVKAIRMLATRMAAKCESESDVASAVAMSDIIMTQLSDPVSVPGERAQCKLTRSQDDCRRWHRCRAARQLVDSLLASALGCIIAFDTKIAPSLPL